MSLPRTAALLISLAALTGCATINDVTTDCRPYGGVRRHLYAMTLPPADQLCLYMDAERPEGLEILGGLPSLVLFNTVRLVDLPFCVVCDTFWLPHTLSEFQWNYADEGKHPTAASARRDTRVEDAD